MPDWTIWQMQPIKAMLTAHPEVDASELGFYTAQVDTEGLQTTTETV